MKEFFKSKISPIFALIMVIAFGYCAIYLMSQVFSQYAGDELLINHSQAQNEQR